MLSTCWSKMHAVFRLSLNFVNLHLRLKGKAILKDTRLISYKHQPSQYPLIYKTIGQIVDEAAEQYGDKTALVSSSQKKRLTFKEVKEQTDIIASAIYSLGGDIGDRVGIWAGNSVEWYITSFAVAKAGLISVYLNPAYLASELETCLNAVGVRILFTNDKFKKIDYKKIFEEIVPEIFKAKDEDLNCAKVPSLRNIISFNDYELPSVISYKNLQEKSSQKGIKKLQEAQKLVSPDDHSNIQFTSGTTGVPKAAVLSHYGIINNAFLCYKRLGITDVKDHVVCFMGPLFHALGSVVGMLSALQTGVPFVIPDEAYSPGKAVDAILQEGCTILLGTPTMYVDVIQILKDRGIKASTPEVAISGGAYAAPALFNDMLDILGLQRIVSVYGSTETGPLTFMSKCTDSKEQMLNTVGSLLDYSEAKVVDKHGKTVPMGEKGELWIRSYGVFRGYYNNEIKTKEAITESGWFKTGDQFTLLEDGYGKIVGRIKDMIIRGGENIYPVDIESALSSHKDVKAVEVVGVPDRRLGEEVCACVLLNSNAKISEEELKHFCKGKMADFKIPKYILFVHEFPKTGSGKVQKFVLRQMAMDALKIKEL